VRDGSVNSYGRSRCPSLLEHKSIRIPAKEEAVHVSQDSGTLFLEINPSRNADSTLYYIGNEHINLSIGIIPSIPRYDGSEGFQVFAGWAPQFSTDTITQENYLFYLYGGSPPSLRR
jgi:hypothetical protein